MLLTPACYLYRSFEMKMLDPLGHFMGYASTYGVDTQRDQMMPGAFTHSLQQWQQKGKFPLLLWHHRLDEPIGFWKRIQEDAIGLYVEGQLMMDLQRAREVYTLIKSKILEGLSIGFQPLISRFDSRQRVRKIYQVNLIEISVVTLPANTEARVINLKHPEVKSQKDKISCQPYLIHEKNLLGDLDRGEGYGENRSILNVLKNEARVLKRGSPF
jgi:HK97 family phage prohead protease